MTFEEAVRNIPIGRYRHFKGNEYEVTGIARHSENEEPMVVYRALYGEYGLWVRPASMWNEVISRGGKTFRRFTRIYPFYGAEHADIRDKSGKTPRDYYDLLSRAWCAETCAPRLRESWTPENKTLGQCSITAFLMQDIYGGKVYGIPLEDGSFHCFNIVNDCLFDLASEQFGDRPLDFSNRVEQFREDHFSDEGKKARYELLKARLDEATASYSDRLI